MYGWGVGVSRVDNQAKACSEEWETIWPVGQWHRSVIGAHLLDSGRRQCAMHDGNVHPSLFQDGFRCRWRDRGVFVEWCCEDAGLAKSALRSHPGVSFERRCIWIEFLKCENDFVLKGIDIFLYSLSHGDPFRAHSVRTMEVVVGNGNGNKFRVMSHHHLRAGINIFEVTPTSLKLYLLFSLSRTSQTNLR